ncbi:hypothetical protein K1719_039416 [Acacia pycnantha]|nr:hypothetical protein K1719_039416 [Acacia pycnantha]
MELFSACGSSCFRCWLLCRILSLIPLKKFQTREPYLFKETSISIFGSREAIYVLYAILCWLISHIQSQVGQTGRNGSWE